MDDMSRVRLYHGLQKLRRGLQQLIREKQSWNSRWPEMLPFDVGWERSVLQCVEQQLEAVARDDLRALSQWSQEMDGIAATEQSL